MSNEYKHFKMAIEAIDPGCPSLEDYDDFIPPSSQDELCSHFHSEDEFISNATNWLSALKSTTIPESSLTEANAEVSKNVQRLIDEAANVDLDDFIALLREDWAARHVCCEA
jgi:hypothetical protein